MMIPVVMVVTTYISNKVETNTVASRTMSTSMLVVSVTMASRIVIVAVDRKKNRKYKDEYIFLWVKILYRIAIRWECNIITNC